LRTKSAITCKTFSELNDKPSKAAAKVQTRLRCDSNFRRIATQVSGRTQRNSAACWSKATSNRRWAQPLRSVTIACRRCRQVTCRPIRSRTEHLKSVRNGSRQDSTRGIFRRATHSARTICSKHRLAKTVDQTRQEKIDVVILPM